MINRITYSVVFPTTGAALKGEFKPQPGITAVIGPNESGKTFTTIELVRYLLFGKKALRGPASDYIKMEVEGEFTIRGHSYTFFRSSKKEQVADAIGTVIAVGAEEVTNKAAELLGYGLNVFDIANASVQKQADLFGQLRPAERKRLIDEVVGLADQEKVEKALRDEGNMLQREAEALLRGHVKPLKPDKPKGYVSSDALQKDYDDAYGVWKLAQEVARRIYPAAEPLQPLSSRVDKSLSELDDALAVYIRTEAERTRLQSIIDNAQVPDYTEQELDAASERLRLKEIAANQVVCPKCGTAFSPGHEHLEIPDGPDLSLRDILAQHKAHEHVQLAKEAKVKLMALDTIGDGKADLEKARHARREWDTYDAQMVAVNAQLHKNAEAEAELRKIGNIASDAELEYMREAISTARTYERDVVNYNSNKDAYDKRNKEIVSLQKRAVDFKQGAKDLATARGSIKSYLAPAISASSSNLMHHMTKGAHSVVTVDEDMNVTVGTQSLDTLSGGAATVANLALRLALGQVLVSETFPVFIGDEMDSDADGDRRETVADALQSLINRDLLKQIILITHRSVDIADHVHDLSPSDTSE